MRSLIAAIVFFSAPAYCLTLSPLEINIVDAVKLENKSQLHFLETLTNIQSGTLNVKGVRETGNIIQKELQHLGFSTAWADEPAAMHRAGTLIAIHHGKGKRVLLIGHLDTVFSKHIPFKKFSQKGNSAHGQGVLDDKGGIAVMLYALKALHKVDKLKNANITVILTGDEEDSGKPVSISRKPLLLAARDRDIALDFEPSLSLGSATVARRGITNWILTVHGNASHSATIFQPDVGVGAIFGISSILDQMRIQMQSIQNLSFNPGIILGGSHANYDVETETGTVAGKENVVASIALAKGDLRYIDTEQKQLAEQKIRSITSAALPGIKTQIDFVDGIPAMAATANNLKLLDEYSKVSMDLDQGKVVAVAAGVRGAGDISYVAGIVGASLSGLGPVGVGSHTVIESVELETMEIQTERTAILLSRLTR